MGLELTEKLERGQLRNWGQAWESGTYLPKADGPHFNQVTSVFLSLGFRVCVIL